MKIVVLSDTHTDSLDHIPRSIVDELSSADFVVHAGDFTGRGLLNQLQRLRNFNGVHGNMDSPDIKQELPAQATIVVGSFRIGITHPSEGGIAFGIEDRVGARLPGVDAIIFGHTHMAKNEYRDKVLYFNPGSATGTFPASEKTFGIITVGEEMKGEILRV